jgi:hypothetical protein
MLEFDTDEVDRTESRNNAIKTFKNCLKEDKDMAIINKKVEVTFYKMKLFQTLFKQSQISVSYLYESLAPKFNRDMVFKAGEGAGRSGSFFFFSHDRRFIIKTLTSSELKLLLGMLENYMDHLVRTNRNSLLAKIFGVFTVREGYNNEVHLMLMENTVMLENPDKLKYMFDLKGSLVDRLVKGPNLRPSSTLKDRNFLMAK